MTDVAGGAVVGVMVVGGFVVVVTGRVVVVKGTKVAVGLGFIASLKPNMRLITTAVITGAVTIKLLAIVPLAIFKPPQDSQIQFIRGRSGLKPQNRW